ncbi:Protein alcS [Talaromyces atroroseus]|uniref:Protein alcS n=1 Tax=Talaromyces atroroseus TaxID=1441469 RepID=A0A225B5U2_TALAT|nr:Protein alcS [Talaromyces atroroseus]OKL61277.1 Protein alcS [Talaromyces atroroseus]
MNNNVSQNDETKVSLHNEENASHALSTFPTSVTLSAEQFERLYLTPMTRRQPQLAKQVGNPTPLALGGFVITTTPLSCCLMAWRGASGNGIAFIGPIVFLGGLLLVITSILEFILGNTFPCVVFGTIGGFWFAFAATMIPAFNAAAPYSSSSVDTITGLSSSGFMNTYAYWRLAEGDAAVGDRCVKGSGASLFVASLLGFYLLIVQLFEALEFPFQLPVGDLGPLWTRKQLRQVFSGQWQLTYY